MTSKTKPVSAGSLEESIGKQKSFELIEEHLFVGALKTMDIMIHDFRVLLAEHGLSDSLYNALRIVVGESSHSDSVTVGKVAQRLVCRNPDTTRLIDKLESQGLVIRTASIRDARQRPVKPTAKGIELIRELARPTRALHMRHFASLNEAEKGTLLHLLEKVRKGLQTSK